MRKLLVLLSAIICAASCGNDGNHNIDINNFNGTYYVGFSQTSLETYHNSWRDREFYKWPEYEAKPMCLENSSIDIPMVFSVDFKNRIFVFFGWAYTITDAKFDVSYEESEDEPGGEYIYTATFHIDDVNDIGTMYELVDLGSEGISLLVSHKNYCDEYYVVWIYHAFCTYNEAMRNLSR